MFQNVALECSKCHNAKIVGVFYDELTKKSSFGLFFKNLLKPSLDYKLSRILNLHIIKSKSVNCQEFQKSLKQLAPDIVLVCSWSEKFSKNTLEIPKIGTVNFHPSLLPKYRGPNPYIHVILNDEKKSGLSLHFMNEKFDMGDILLQKEIIINENETSKSLRLKTTRVARSAVVELFKKLETGSFKTFRQEESLASYQRAIGAKDILIDFNYMTSDEILKRIRAIKPFNKMYFAHRNFFFQISNVEKTSKIVANLPNGTVICQANCSLEIVCSDKKVLRFSNLKIFGFLGKLRAILYLKFIRIKKIM